MNSTGNRVVNTVCGMCNRQSCGMEVTIENGRVVSVKGSREFPTNQGALCVKGTAAKELLYDPRRLKHPMKKKGRTWKKISWSEASMVIADKLKEVKENYGAESFAVYCGCPQLGETSPFIHRFMNLYGSPNIVTVGSMCAIMRTLVDQLTFGSNFRFVDVEGSRCIVVWGANPAASNSPYYLNLRTLLEAKNRGAKIFVIDPVISGTASIADKHIRIRPGTDGALADKTVDEIEEYWADWKFWFELAKIMGYEKMFPWNNIEDAIDYQLKPTGLSVENLKGKPGLFYGDTIKFNKYTDGGFKTSTGKVELYSTILRNLGYAPLPNFIEPEESPINAPDKAKDYPLVLITGSRLAAYPHSGLRGLPSLMKIVAEPEAFIHPSTAQEFSVKNGDTITIETERGSINLKALVTEKIIPRTVSIPHG